VCVGGGLNPDVIKSTPLGGVACVRTFDARRGPSEPFDPERLGDDLHVYHTL